MKTASGRKTLKHSLASKGLYDDSSGKGQEVKVLHGFLQRLQLGHYKAIAGERPDFTLNFGLDGQNVSVGCEITHYFADKGSRGSGQARFVGQWKKFAKSLRAELDKEGQRYKHLYGAIHFNNPDFDIMDRFDNAALISEIVFAVKDTKSKQHLSNFEKAVLPLLAEHVNHIYLMNTTPESGVLWWPSHLQSGEVPDPTTSLIEIVQEKNAVGHAYDWGNVAEKWLLIYSGAAGIADMVVLPPDLKVSQTLGKLCFDRVYVWDRFFESIDEIFPKVSKLFSAESNVLYRKLYPTAVRPFILSPNEDAAYHFRQDGTPHRLRGAKEAGKHENELPRGNIQNKIHEGE